MVIGGAAPGGESKDTFGNFWMGLHHHQNCMIDRENLTEPSKTVNVPGTNQKPRAFAQPFLMPAVPSPDLVVGFFPVKSQSYGPFPEQPSLTPTDSWIQASYTRGKGCHRCLLPSDTPGYLGAFVAS
ncbi:unnamed protein product [Rangifer tarandus platyrhynchus]|uniref:Uncharacterized protein n=1 Tax=Rangifer tarandus platyrhynchus TaxID=3082113 RepID=A0AC59YHQ8_RANTA